MGFRVVIGVVLAALALAVSLVLPTFANAAFPGTNGKVAYTAVPTSTRLVNPDGSGDALLSPGDFRAQWSPDGTRLAVMTQQGEIATMAADGSGRQIVVTGDENFYYEQPSWSPDGEQLVLVGAGTCGSEPCPHDLWVASSDGTNLQNITPQFGNSAQEPDWSPDGSKIAFMANGDIHTIRPDGTDVQQLTFAQDAFDPDWSPDGSRIVFQHYGDLATVGANGGPLTVLAHYTYPLFPTDPVWSPDGTKILYALFNTLPTRSDLHLMNADGTGDTELPIPGTREHWPDWQPVLKGYPRPKGAGTLHAPLVPAYNTCTSPNRVHAAPLSYNSCNPPSRTSTQLTVGTPDANGRAANSNSSLRIGVVPGNPGTPADEAEARFTAAINDVRLASDLSDYSGNLEARIPFQITDRSNTPYPGGPGPGTVQGFDFTFAIPCAATADPNVGSNCNLLTTADTLLPGSALETRRAIWETNRIEVRDGAGQPFLRQGIFIP